MIRFSFLLFIALLFSCSSKEDRAKKACKKYLNETLHDIKSYEEVSWGEIDSAFTTAENSAQVIALEKDFDVLENDIKERIDSMKLYGDAWKAIGEYKWRLDHVSQKTEELQKISNKIDSIAANWKPEFIGFKIKHTFRSKTLSGNFRIAHYTFFLNPELTTVIKQEDNSESN